MKERKSVKEGSNCEVVDIKKTLTRRETNAEITCMNEMLC